MAGEGINSNADEIKTFRREIELLACDLGQMISLTKDRGRGRLFTFATAYVGGCNPASLKQVRMLLSRQGALCSIIRALLVSRKTSKAKLGASLAGMRLSTGINNTHETFPAFERRITNEKETWGGSGWNAEFGSFNTVSEVFEQWEIRILELMKAAGQKNADILYGTEIKRLMQC